jgi:hypothetical protein
MKCFIGMDPGKSGAVAVLATDGTLLGVCRLSETPKDVVDCLREITKEFEPVVALEKVGVMPGEGVSGAFSFGTIAGGLEWACVCLDFRYEKVTPQAWQKGMGVPTRGTATKTEHKNSLKAKAQALFPRHKVTLYDADALLLAEFARRTMA